MQASAYTERKGSAAVRSGLLFGAIGAVVYIVSEAIQDLTGTTVALITRGSPFTPLSFLGQASLMVGLVLFFVAGLRTARTDATLGAAAAAGLIAALMVWAVEMAILVVNEKILYSSTIARLASEQRLVEDGWHAAMFGDLVLAGLLMIIIYVSLGSGLGFVGGILQGQIRQEALWH